MIGIPLFPPPGLHALVRDRRGTALIELAIALPVLLILLMGIVAYGDWFLIAHGVQQSANDAARSTIAGLTAAERSALAQASVQTGLARAGIFDPRRTLVTVDDDGATVVVHVAYDASANPLLRMPMVPMPSTMIERSAAIRVDGL